jgi:tRNA A-37 threonylcarbamoyl transferase component Bud32
MDQSPKGDRYRQGIEETAVMLKKPSVLGPNDCIKVDHLRVGSYAGMLLSSYNTPAMVDGLHRFIKADWAADTIVTRNEDREVHCCAINQDEVVYIKRYHIAGIKPLLRTVLRLNKAQKAWRIGRGLYRKGIDTPLPIALFKCWTSCFSLEFVCITKGLPDAVDLHKAVLQVHGNTPSQKKKKRRLIIAVAKFAARLHSNNIYHGDFSADNILVWRNESTGAIRVYLIDLDAVRTSYRISERRRIKNLEELGRNFLNLRTISIADRFSFIKIYMVHYAGSKDGLTTFFRKVKKRTEIRLSYFGQSFDH